MSLSFQPLIDALDGQADRVAALQQTLTACRALGPENGGQGEEEKTAFIAAQLRVAGVTDLRRFDAPDPRVPCGHRPNLVARIPGRSPRTLWIFAHTDVVPSGPVEEWSSDPWQVRREGDLLYGRGVEDNQQGLVSMLLLAEALHSTGLTPELSLGLVFMADEETGNGYGLAHLLRSTASALFRHDDLFLVPDSGSPSGADMEVAEKSIAQFRVRTRGLQGHASTPHKARNALSAAAEAITALGDLERDFPREDPLFDPPRSTFVPTRHDANGPGINVIPGEDVFSGHRPRRRAGRDPETCRCRGAASCRGHRRRVNPSPAGFGQRIRLPGGTGAHTGHRGGLRQGGAPRGDRRRYRGRAAASGGIARRRLELHPQYLPPA